MTGRNIPFRLKKKTPNANASISNTIGDVIPSEISFKTSNNCTSKPKETSIIKDLERVIQLHKDERHLVAYKLYRESMDKIEKLESAQNYIEERLFLSKHQPDFSRLALYATLFEECKEGMVEESWIYSHSLFGVSTYYRHEKDNTLSIKLEGNLEDLPLLEQLAVLRELDLYHTWAPFVTQSHVIGRIARCDLVGWYLVQVPFMMSRDAAYRAISCDCLTEDGSILIVAKGLHDHGNQFISDIPNDLNIPDPPKSWNGARMNINSFSGVINLTSPTSAKTKLVANIDLHLPLLPQPWIEFALKKMCGMLLHRMEAAAKHAIEDPVNSPHAIRIRQDTDFYHKWLWPKFERCCNAFQWDMPVVKALSIKTIVTTEDLSTSNSINLTENIESTVIASPVSFWNQQKLKQKLQKEQKIKAQRQMLVELLRPTPITPENKLRLHSLEQKKNKLQNNVNHVNYTNNNDCMTLKESLVFISQPTILLLLELTLFQNLNNYELFSSFLHDIIRDQIISVVETTVLLSIFAYFYSFTMHHTLLQIFNILETSVFHYQDALLEMKRYYKSIMQRKFKSFTFVMIIIWTIFCMALYAIGSYWTFHFLNERSMKYLLLDTTKAFFIYSSAFMVSVVIFLSLLSATWLSNMLVKKKVLGSIHDKQNESCCSSTVVSKHSSISDPTIGLSHTEEENDNNIVTNALHDKNHQIEDNSKEKYRKKTTTLAEKSKHGAMKLHIKALAHGYSHKIKKKCKKSPESSRTVENNETLPSPIKKRKLFQVKKKQNHEFVFT